MQRYDVIVIGQGYAGLKTALLSAQRGLSTAVAEKMFPGGLIMSINHLDPAPEGEEPSGAGLSADLSMAVMDVGVESLDGEVVALAQDGEGWLVETDAGRYAAANVVIASGARLKRLDVPGVEEFAGLGVSECADCDGPLYHGKAAVIVGGGDSAFQEAVALTSYCNQVTIVMRGAEPRARADLVAAVAAHSAITVLPSTEVTEIVGDASGVAGVRLSGEGAPADSIDCAVIFMFVGLAPDVAYLPEAVARDDDGAVIGDADGRTGLPGLWVVGAARSGFGGLLIDAAVDAQRLAAAL